MVLLERIVVALAKAKGLKLPPNPTFGERLSAAGVPFEQRQVLLGHKNGSITTHYSTPRILELVEAAERAVQVPDSISVVRVIAGTTEKNRAKVAQPKQRTA